MLFVECYRKQLQYVPLIYNTVPNFSTLFGSEAPSQAFRSKLFGSVAASSETLSFFLALIAEHLESFAPLLESCMHLPHICFTVSNGCKARPKLFTAFKT